MYRDEAYRVIMHSWRRWRKQHGEKVRSSNHYQSTNIQITSNLGASVIINDIYIVCNIYFQVVFIPITAELLFPKRMERIKSGNSVVFAISFI